MEQFDWTGMLISWLPLYLIFGIMIVIILWARRGGGIYGQQNREIIANQKEAVEVQRRQTEALERIAAALEKRSQ